jgi:RHS repeat-associated protein
MATSPASFVDWQTCATGGSVPPYDELGRNSCAVFDGDATSNDLVTTLVTTSMQSGDPIPNARVTKTQKKVGGTVLLDTYQTSLVSGFVVESGTIGAMATQYFTTPSAPATYATRPTVIKVVNQGTPANVANKTVLTFDNFGFLTQRELFLGDGTTLKRKTTFVKESGDEEMKVAEERNWHGAGPSDYYTTSFDYDPTSDELTTTTEPDGDAIVRSYFAANGRLKSIGIGSDTLTEYAYTRDGNIATILRGKEKVADYTYAADGKVLEETIDAARGIKRRYEETLATATKTILGVSTLVGQRRASVRTYDSTGAGAHYVLTTYDNAGRPEKLEDGSTIIVDWVYEAKGSAYAGTWYTEGTVTGSSGQRTVTLNDDNQRGRLAYVKHPAGGTFFQYDALGRVRVEARYESSPLAGHFTTPVTLANLKTTEITYADGTGELTKVRYPSGRAASYGYNSSGDRRMPSGVAMYLGTDGLTNSKTIAYGITLDADGMPLSWKWGTPLLPPNVPTHTITRDLLGRVTNFKDRYSLTTRASVDIAYTTSSESEDGDPSSWVDNGPLAGIFSTSGNQSVSFAYSSSPPDMLTTWEGTDGVIHALTLTSGGDGRRASEDANLQTYTYGYAGGDADEEITLLSAAGTQAYEIDVTQNLAAEVTAVDYGNNGSNEISSMTYGSRGDVTSLTASSTAWNHYRDEGMRRWKRNSSTTTIFDRWGAGDRILERHQTQSSNYWRDEYVYLGSTPIGVVHVDQTNTTPTVYWLSPDHRGTPRRVLAESSTLATQTSRLVMDAWGNGVQTPAAGTGVPALPFRFAGQVQDIETKLIENRWRMYMPDLGMYASSDRFHRIALLRGPGSRGRLRRERRHGTKPQTKLAD